MGTEFDIEIDLICRKCPCFNDAVKCAHNNSKCFRLNKLNK